MLTLRDHEMSLISARLIMRQFTCSSGLTCLTSSSGSTIFEYVVFTSEDMLLVFTIIFSTGQILTCVVCLGYILKNL